MTKTVLALMRGSGPSTRPSSSSVIAAFVLVVAAAAPFFLEWGSYASETNLPLTLLLTGRRVAMMISKDYLKRKRKKRSFNVAFALDSRWQGFYRSPTFV